MRLFVKIRINSWSFGKVKTYFMYALGEVILISIGILIAWKIDNLNEIRKSRAEELKIYTSLGEELDTNLKIIDKAILHYTEEIKTLQNTLNYVGLSSNKLTQGAKDTIIAANFTKTNLLNGSLNSIINSKFELLESNLLKDLISVYPGDIEAFKAKEEIVKNTVINRIHPVLEKHLSLIDILSKQNPQYDKIRAYGRKSNYTALLKSREYQNSIIDRLLQSEDLLAVAKSLRKKTLIISVNLNQELFNDLGWGY